MKRDEGGEGDEVVLMAAMRGHGGVMWCVAMVDAAAEGGVRMVERSGGWPEMRWPESGRIPVERRRIIKGRGRDI
ncbi:hypothetical protein Tco_0762078 [Tanacetum coccineum]